VCGHVEFGMAPDMCPVCHAPKEKFNMDNDLFSYDSAKSKDLAVGHVPVLSVDKSSKLIVEQPTKEVTVRVGKKLHPMVTAHHIEWIDCYVDGHYISRVILTQGSNPAVRFYPGMTGSKVKVVEHCNLHGHWEAEAAL
jgi:superoxide reductase